MGFFDIFRPDVRNLAANQDVEGLIKVLQSEDTTVQLEAAEALRLMGESALPRMVPHLSGNDNLALRLLGIIGRMDNIRPEKLCTCLKSCRFSRSTFASLAETMGPDSVGILICVLEEADEETGKGIIGALSHAGPAAIPTLISALDNPSFRVRDGAVRALKSYSWKPQNEQEYIRFLIASRSWDELSRAKKPAVVPVSALLSDPYYAIRRDAARVLGELGDSSAVPALLSVFQDPDPEVCVNAIDALARIHDRRAVPQLKTALQHPNYGIRLAAARGLTAFNWSPANETEKVQLLLASEQWDDLIHLGKHAIPALVLALGDEYYGVRMSAAEALRKMGNVGRETLQRATVNKNPTIRQTATDFLRKLKEDQKPDNPSGVTVDKSPQASATNGQKTTPCKPGINPQLGIRHASEKRPTPAQVQRPESGPQTPATPPPAREAPDKNSPGENPDPNRQDAFPDQKKAREFPAPPPGQSEAGGDENKGNPELAMLIETLGHSDPQVKAIAVESLARFGNEAVDPLVAALADPSSFLRITIADVLGRIQDSRAVPALIALMGDADKDVREAAASALGNIGNIQALVPLVKILDDPEDVVRTAAIVALSRLGKPAIPFLVPLLSHSRPDIRSGSAAALGTLGAKEAIPQLAALFADKEEIVRESAAHALGTIGTPALSALSTALNNRNVSVRLCAVTGLGLIGEPALESLLAASRDSDPDVSSMARMLVAQITADKDAVQELDSASPVYEAFPEEPPTGALLVDSVPDVEPFIRLLCHHEKEIQIESHQKIVSIGASAIRPLVRALASENPEIQAGAAEALVEIGEPSVLPLIATLDEEIPGKTRQWIILALGKLGDLRAVPRLRTLLSDEDSIVRGASAEALGYIGDTTVVHSLGELLNDRNEQVKISAARALEYIGDASAVSYLIPVLGDEEYTVRKVVIEALSELGAAAVPVLNEALQSTERDVRAGAVTCLDNIGWKPETEFEQYCYLTAQENWIQLACLGDSAIPWLSTAIEIGDEESRIGAITALSRMSQPTTIEPLIRALNDKNFIVKRKVMMALAEKGDPARRMLISACEGKSPEFRQIADQIIGLIDRKSRTSAAQVSVPTEEPRCPDNPL